ncbi:MAG: gephyrin-like molybdotransferase Glp [Methylococcus sp.]
MTLDEALERLLRAVVPVAEIERLPLAEALGRILAKDMDSPLDLPPFTQSAMDGYAVRASEALPGARLRVVGRSMAGAPCPGPFGAGECARIFTGACLPEGLDAVVIQERTEQEGDFVRLMINSPVRAGDNVRQRGEELQAGECLLAAGTRLRPADIGVLAVAGRREVEVWRRPKVAFLATGDELAEPGQPLAPGCIYESNRPALRALLTQWGMDTLDLGVIRDDRESLRRALLSGAEQADVLITTGGASVGEADYVVDLLRESGQVEFWKVAIKPGKPFVLGRVGETPVFGLPGNPVSMMVTLMQLARPALTRLAGSPPHQPVRWRVETLNPLRKSPGRLEFQRGVLACRDGIPVVTALPRQGSHLLTTMSRANCFIILPAGEGVIAPGERVEIEPFDPVPQPSLGLS